jgi:hypothetical protein
LPTSFTKEVGLKLKDYSKNWQEIMKKTLIDKIFAKGN